MSTLLNRDPAAIVVSGGEPWKVQDPVHRAQTIAVHLATPLLASLITVLTPISGYSGFLVVWLPLHIVTAALLGRFGRRQKSFANSTLEVLLGAAMVVFAIFVVSVLSPVVTKGIGGLHPNMFTQDASTTDIDAPLTTGGLLHAILGSLLIVGIATLVAVPVGILAALYVTEVRGKLTPFVRFFVQAMSGLPSIVAGLFVYAAFIVTGVMQFSGVAGSVALAVLMLPTVARTAEEILRLVPDDLRTAALALGGTQWRVVAMVVLPAARAGLVTAAVLGIARVAGETAPLMLTAFGNTTVNVNPFKDSMASLPQYIFNQMLLGGDNDVARAWTACLVLLVLVAVLFTGARLAANRLRNN